METFLTVVWLSASAVSIGTTEYAIRQPGLVEANIFMRPRAVRVTFNVAVPVAYFVIRKRMTKRERIGFLAASAAVRVVDAVHNIRVLKHVDHRPRQAH